MTEPGTEPTADETVTRATTMLGEPEELFRASPRWQRAKFAAASAMILFGIVANGLWFGIGPAQADHVLLHFLLLPPAIGVGLLWHMWRHRGLRVLIYPAGLLRLQHGEAESFPWDEITSIRFKIDPDGEPQIEHDDNGQITCAWLATTSPTFQVWNVWLEITRNDGATARFTAALAEFPELVESIQRKTFAGFWQSTCEALDRGEVVSFGDRMTATDETLSSQKATVKWSEIKQFSITGRFLFVKRKGAWASTIARDLSTIANLHVLFALAADRGVLEFDEAHTK